MSDLIRKHIGYGADRTTVALERTFWEAIDRLGNGDAVSWTAHQLESRPATVGRASWLRQQVLREAMRHVE